MVAHCDVIAAHRSFDIRQRSKEKRGHRRLGVPALCGVVAGRELVIRRRGFHRRAEYDRHLATQRLAGARRSHIRQVPNPPVGAGHVKHAHTRLGQAACQRVREMLGAQVVAHRRALPMQHDSSMCHRLAAEVERRQRPAVKACPLRGQTE
ncbi:hypothetical protein G6F68_015273 [Rhizopus microsporus]|nr:hypothetical protein G6F68_015273 [Rhizopus microsporus]